MAIIEGTRGPILHGAAPTAATNEIQTLTLSDVPASGEWRVVFEGYKTPLLAHNVSAVDMQAALVALPSIGASGCTVGLVGQVYTVTFGGGNMAGKALPLLTVEDNSIKNAGAVAVTVAIVATQEGVTATARGAAKGAILIDTATPDVYINDGTALVPVWTKVSP